MHQKSYSNRIMYLYRISTIFVIMGKFHDFEKMQFRLSRPKLLLNWEIGNEYGVNSKSIKQWFSK